MTDHHTLEHNPLQFVIPAYVAWIEAEGLTPDLLFSQYHPNLIVPNVMRAKDENAMLVLNVGATATANMNYGPDGLSFSARFAGKSENVFIPYKAIAGLRMRGARYFIPISDVALSARSADDFGDIDELSSAPVVQPPKAPVVESRDGNVTVVNFGRK